MPKVLANIAFLAGFVLCTATADARIICRGGYQMSGGQEISTPYCNDEHLAQIARGRGSKVTAAAIRNNPNVKDEVCRLVGAVPPGSDYCPPQGGSQGIGK